MNHLGLAVRFVFSLSLSLSFHRWLLSRVVSIFHNPTKLLWGGDLLFKADINSRDIARTAIYIHSVELGGGATKDVIWGGGPQAREIGVYSAKAQKQRHYETKTAYLGGRG